MNMIPRLAFRMSLTAPAVGGCDDSPEGDGPRNSGVGTTASVLPDAEDPNRVNAGVTVAPPPHGRAVVPDRSVSRLPVRSAAALNKATAVAHAIESETGRLNALRHVALAEAELGGAIAAAAVISHILDATADWPDDVHKVRVLLTVAETNHVGQDREAYQRAVTRAALTANRSEQSHKVAGLRAILELQQRTSDQAGLARTVKELTAALGAAGKPPGGESERDDLARAIATALARLGRFADAAQSARAIRQHAKRVDALCIIAVAHESAGDRAAAAAIFREAHNVAVSVSGHDRQTTALLRASALDRIAEAQARANDPDAALATIGEISGESNIGYRLASVAEAFVRIGRSEDGVKAARRIKQADERSSALRRVAQAIGTDGDTGVVLELLSEASDLLRHEKPPQIFSISETAVAWNTAGDSSRCSLLLQDALAAARAVGEPTARSRSLKHVAVAAAGTGDLELALSLTDEISEGDPEAAVEAYVAAARALAQPR